MVTAESVAKALSGRKIGSGWIAHCPGHDDNEPSLAISAGENGKVLIFCHAGCGQTMVIAALRVRGLWHDCGHQSASNSRRETLRESNIKSKDSDTKRIDGALRLWKATSPAPGSLAEAYLRSRGLQLPPLSTIRFHAGLKHPSGGVWPALVALVARGSDGTPIAIHRTFLARDGSDKAPIKPNKMMLGPCSGCAVRLSKFSEELMVGEGIETCLASMQATGRPAWAALSTSGLRALGLPDTVRNVIVLADGDDPGEAAARDCGDRWKSEGRSVRIARAPRGYDFNDVLIGVAPQIGRVVS